MANTNEHNTYEHGPKDEQRGVHDKDNYGGCEWRSTNKEGMDEDNAEDGMDKDNTDESNTNEHHHRQRW